MHIPHRYQCGQQRDRIPDHIIMQGVKNISSLSDIEVPVRNHQPMLRQQLSHDLPKIAGIVSQRLKVLAPAVHLPDQRSIGKEKPGKAAAGRAEKRDGINEVIPALFCFFREHRPKTVNHHQAVFPLSTYASACPIRQAEAFSFQSRAPAGFRTAPTPRRFLP